MSKINAIRIVNLNYNNNAIHVDDELFELGTENTLFSLRNGGGKSVLVQMMSAPFVRKRYRDTKDRPFESYFTNSTPTYILVEWVLDDTNSYLLTGMMVRKAMDRKEDENQDPLDTIQFIYEYRERNDYDIYRFPLVSVENDRKKLLQYGQAKQLFEELKRDHKYQFNSYDMNLYNQNRSYFDRLKEYGINHKEWESIIKKINLKESGLSELFSEAKDEIGLVDKWFLPAIEDKLNKEETSRIDKFVELIQKYILQFRENRSNFVKKENIHLFHAETKNLLDLAVEYQARRNNQSELENEIANLILCLKQIQQNIEISIKESYLAVDSIKKEMNQIECSQIAYGIYIRQDELNNKIEQMKSCDAILKEMEEEIRTLELKTKQYDCCRVHKECEALQSEIKSMEAKLDVLHRRNEDLAPERENLGYSIHQYYQKQYTKAEEQLEEQEVALRENIASQEKYVQTMDQYRTTIETYSEEIGVKKSSKKSYALAEEEFNVRYQQKLSRNIVGSYEDHLLDSMTNSLEQEAASLEEQKRQLQVEEEQVKRMLEEKEHQFNELRSEDARLDEKFKQLTSEEEEYQQMILVRKATLSYVNLTEDDIFDTVKINAEFEHKIKEIESNLRQTLIHEDGLKKELEQLKSGKILELPREIDEKLRQHELQYIYGTDWLKNNGKTVEENKELVKANPFLPYAIILGMADYERLRKLDLGVYTSFPIPIVRRDDLVHLSNTKDDKVYSYKEISFYVAFNHNLLDKNGLHSLILQKESEISGCRKRIQQMEEEIKLYEDKKNSIWYQGLQKKMVDRCKLELRKSKESKESIQNELTITIDEVKNLKQKQLILVKTSESILNSMKLSKEKQDAFFRLKTQYEEYIKDLERLTFLEDENKRLRLQIQSIKLAEARLKTRQNEILGAKQNLQMECNVIQDNLHRFEAFTEGILLEQSIEEMEARYQTITQNLFQEESVLTQQLAQRKKKLEEVSAELKLLVSNYQLKVEDFEHLSYNAEIVLEIKKHLSVDQEKRDQKIEEKRRISNEITRMNAEIFTKKQEYEKKSRQQELIPRNQVVAMDFEAKLHEKYFERTDREKECAKLEEKRVEIQNVLESLSEYEEFVIKKPVVISVANREISSIKNEILKNYRLAKEMVMNLRVACIQELNRLLRVKEFQEEYFHKPLEALERVIDSPDVILEQMNTTIQAYDHLLEKLSIDLEMIEQEGQKVLEVLLQYVQEVHENLGRIDRNSTITIRERNVKMLQIKLPDWEAEKLAYHKHCRELLDQIVNRCLELLDENKNIEEYVASQITTKNLYHTIVGVGNIGIHLYKIEEEREYPITWAEVSKNSGGEGFLSAFVILSSLLCYMRREDADIFNDKDNGKVLIMDNPFAQTNASHLLKPLMDIAKKSNTQLICLSGLGGESIYNRFDNIYVLNLITSKIKDSMKYLYGEHMKGEELESIVSSRIRIEEEQMVLF